MFRVTGQTEAIVGAAEVLAGAGLTRSDVYDAFLLRGDQVPSILDFVSQRTTPGARWLDGGCGTGRLLTGLVELGLELEGIDLDGDYLERARGRAPDVPLCHGDFASARFEERFDGVLLANGPLAYLLEPAALAASLEALARSLCEGGVLIADTPDFPWILEHYLEPSLERAAVGSVQIERRPRHTILDNRFSHEDTISLSRDGVEIGRYRETYEFAIRSAEELIRALRHAGFERIVRWKNWHATQPDREAPGPRILLTASR